MDGYSSFPPNAPPVSICTTRILSSGRPHNRINGLTKHATVCMCQKQKRLFGMIHCFGGQARLVVQDQGDAVFPRNVFGCYQDKLVPRNARIKANLSDLSPRYVATYGCAVKH